MWPEMHVRVGLVREKNLLRFHDARRRWCGDGGRDMGGYRYVGGDGWMAMLVYVFNVVSVIVILGRFSVYNCALWPVQGLRIGVCGRLDSFIPFAVFRRETVWWRIS